MRTIFLFAIATFLLKGAEDPWAKVKELKSGTELRILKRGSKQPIVAKSDDVTDDKLLVVIKNSETAIDKEDIDQIDFRPSGGSSMTTETRETKRYDGAREPAMGLGGQNANPESTSTSTSVNWGSKPGFKTIYRRTVSATSPPN